MFTRPLIAAIALIATTAPALAQSTETVFAQVQSADLDLAAPADRARLNTRIRSAARSMCDSGQNGVAAQIAETRCFDAALASAEVATSPSASH